MINTILGLAASVAIIFGKPAVSSNRVLSQVSYSLADRYADTYVNNVFSDNILLTLAYMGGEVKDGQDVNWDKVKSMDTVSLFIKPGQTFAFHDAVMGKYAGKVASTTNAHFNSYEGFKSDGWLVGDGVCHLASFMYAASKEAGLQSEAPTRHDFATIPEVPKELGVSIYYSPDNPSTSTLQNLYITNNREKTVAFVFNKEKNDLNIKVEEIE